ncbi:MAG: amidotransferase 1, exosortase A system-associated [Alphaproteobacteria bacterium]|nr:amidotransferase 1, exosortase A system-associated [Alphaproteobacteria bacterium]
MCGITGVLLSSGKPVNQDALRRMNTRLAHRGPDADGFFWGQGVALGHRRLSIIDVAGGVQPMLSDDEGVVLTFNGEIYNFQYLRRELEGLGYSFRTNSDTEVLITAYLAWGRDCVTRLRGMFAFAIWDNRTGELFVARDRLGIKPVYYCSLPDGTFLFASEMKALLTYPGVGRSLRLDALEDYLALGYVPDPKSILQNIHKLPPACTITVNQSTGKQDLGRYWNVDVVTPPLREEDPEELLERLEEAVKLRMIADVPLGAFLSGGVDSSTIVGLMSRNSSQPVETCSVGSDMPDFDESGHAQLVADHFGTHHRLRLVSAHDSDLIDTMPDLYDEPFGDMSALPTYRVCALARETVTVALSGDGGDELFGGYRRYKFHMMEERMRSALPLGVRRAFFGPLSRIYPKMDWAPQYVRAKSTFEALARTSAEAYFQSVSKMPDRDRLRLHTDKMRKHLAGYHPHDRFKELAQEAEGAHPLSIVQYIDMHTYLPGDILTKVDRASMAHSLEVRVPILDHKFVEWGLRLSPDSRIVDGSGKAVMKQAVRGLIPDEIIDRPKKGFNIPAGQWMREELAPMLQELATSEILLDTGLIDRKGLSEMVEEHLQAHRDHHAALWNVLMLERSLSKLEASSAQM